VAIWCQWSHEPLATNAVPSVRADDQPRYRPALARRALEAFRRWGSPTTSPAAGTRFPPACGPWCWRCSWASRDVAPSLVTRPSVVRRGVQSSHAMMRGLQILRTRRTSPGRRTARHDACRTSHSPEPRGVTRLEPPSGFVKATPFEGFESRNRPHKKPASEPETIVNGRECSEQEHAGQKRSSTGTAGRRVAFDRTLNP
jgi:hypothetical protein